MAAVRGLSENPPGRCFSVCMRTVANPVSEDQTRWSLDGPSSQAPAEDWFDELFERFYASLYGLAYRLLGDRLEAEDTVQQVHLAAFLHLEQFEGRASYATWITRIAIREAIGRRA